MIADAYLLVEGPTSSSRPARRTQVAEVVEALSAKGNIEGIPADLSTDEDSSTSAEAQRWDRLDILCNNAGALSEPLESFSPGGWDKVMNVNVRSVFFLTQKPLPLLRAGASAEDPSRIINTGSVNGLTPPGMTPLVLVVQGGGAHATATSVRSWHRSHHGERHRRARSTRT